MSRPDPSELEPNPTEDILDRLWYNASTLRRFATAVGGFAAVLMISTALNEAAVDSDSPSPIGPADSFDYSPGPSDASDD